MKRARKAPRATAIASSWSRKPRDGNGNRRSRGSARHRRSNRGGPHLIQYVSHKCVALERAHPEFESLWAGGEFTRHVRELLQPALDAVGKPPAEEGNGA